MKNSSSNVTDAKNNSFSDNNLVRPFHSRIFRALIGLVLISIVSFSMYLILYTLTENRKQTIKSVEDELKFVLEMTHDRMDFFVKERKSYLLQLGRDSELVKITEELLTLPTDADSLKKSAALKKARDYFARREQEQHNIGFFIISPDNISLGSRRDTNLGTQNFIGLRKPALMAQVFQGKVVFVPPLKSDVPLESQDIERPKTLFFAAPIQTRDNKVIAILTQRLLPENALSEIIQQGRIGKSGESYLVDEFGSMFTTSRFRQQLIKLELLVSDSPSTQMELRDPGGDLLDGYIPRVPLKERPFTYMAEDIRSLSQQPRSSNLNDHRSKIIINMKGYRDYRGVTVYGAWIWNRTLGVGFATEIDEKEAMANFNNLQRIFLLTTAITLISTLFAIGLILVLGKKARKARIDAETKNLLEKIVTERTQELKKLTVAIEQSPSSIAITDLKANIEYVNPRFTEVTGYTAEEVIGKNPRVLKSDLTPKETFEDLWETLTKGEVWHGEFINQRKNGATYWERTVIAPIRNEAGIIDHYVAVKDDITKYKEAEEKSTRLGRVLEESWNEIYMFDPDTLFLIQVNKGARHNLGYSMDELKKLTTVDIKPDYSLDYFKNIIQPLREGKLPFILFQTRHQRKDGSIYPIEVRLQLVKTENTSIFVGIIQDITERNKAEDQLKRAKEAAEQASLAKSQFVANMSHELRTPLNAILGFSQIMANSDNLTAKQRENIKIINRSGDHLLNLIDDVLNISKIEAGKIVLQKSDFDLLDLLAELEPLFQDKLAKNKLTLNFEYHGNIPKYIHTDKTKLRQVLVNLISNAIKFTSKGGITLRLWLPQTFKTNLMLAFEVEDTGCGIAASELEKVFQTFMQTSSGLKSEEGAGLGLAITRQFIKLMEGDIHVESTPNKGSIFKFNLVVNQPKENVVAEPTSFKIVALEPNQSKHNILIVDDDYLNRLILIELLSPFGFQIKEAENGQIAIDICKEWEPHLVFMDMRMPVMNGFDASRIIKEHLKHTIIVAVTASVFEDKKEQIFESGCDEFISKPFRHTDIFEIMQRYLGVKYICEETKDKEDDYILTKDSLSVLPDELRDKLKQAIEIVDIDQVEILLKEIDKLDVPLAEAIKVQIDNFEYEVLLKLFSD
ncbi:MAG: PAS domain S-box protein [Methylococcales bacterium]|nr:PAS domain S-box protein [Methylococcales bacterium]